MSECVDLDKRTGNVAKQFTYDQAVDLSGHGRYNYLQLTACSVIIHAAALDMFGHCVVVAAAACDLNLTVTAAGVLASAPFAGLISAFPWGYYADTRGRRKALLISTTVGFTFAVLTTFAPTWQVMFGLKLLGCIFYRAGCGRRRPLVLEIFGGGLCPVVDVFRLKCSTAAFTITMTYLGECTNSKYRSRYLFIMNTANLGAEIVFYALAHFLLPLTFEIPIPCLGIAFRPWRLYSLILAVPLGLGALMMLPLKESPKFLANRGDENQALEVLRTMFECNGGSREDFSVKSLSDSTTNSSEDPFWSSLVRQTVPLFKPPLLWRTIQLFYLVAVCCSTNNVFVMWYPTMVNQFFKSAGDEQTAVKSFCQRAISNVSTVEDQSLSACNDVISPNTLYAGIILGVLLASLNLLAAVAASYRRLIFITSLLVPAVCLVLVNQITDPIGNLIAFTLVQSTALGIGCLASYFVDLYPTAFRGLAWSLGMMMGRLTTLVGVNLVGAVIVHHCTLTFYCCTGFVCTGLILTLFLPSDKKNVK